MKRLIIKRKAKSTVDRPIAWPGPDAAGKAPSFEYQWMDGETSSAYGTRQMFLAMFGEDMGDAPMWIAKLACLYGASILAKGRVGDVTTAKEWKMYRMCRELDVVAVRLETDIDKYMECNLTNLKGGSAMSKTTGSKTAKAKRVTAASVLIPILSRAAVPTNDEIIETVRAATGSDLFDAKQLAWYMWKFRRGNLKGMDGKLHAISQKAAHKKEAKAPAKGAAKKVVLKKKAA